MHEEIDTFTTVTTDMRDFIGNVVDRSDKRVTVKGIYRGTLQEVRNIKPLECNLNRRVMVTEHLDINGKFGLVATNKPILFRGVNFVNFGWKHKETGKRRFIRIDIYTGNSCLLEM